MEKEFVPYTESLELKQLGFDEPCFGRFDGRGKNKGKIWYEMPNTGQDSIPVGDVLAPTFSQAFRWFRETYDLMGLILPYLIIGNRWRYQITNRNNSSGLPFEEGFDTYEEAELACLRKLINLVKQKP